MSTQTQNSDAYTLYKQNVQKYFENITKQTPQYFQSITHLQDECMKTCEKAINATVSMQQEFAKKSGMKTDIPDSAKTAIVDTNKQIVQASTINNQLVKTTRAMTGDRQIERRIVVQIASRCCSTPAECWPRR